MSTTVRISELPFSFTLGLIFDAVEFFIGFSMCLLIFPFVFTAYGYFLMGIIGIVSFTISLPVNRKILVSFKAKPTKRKQCWFSMEWAIVLILWTVAPYTPRPIQHVLFFIGFGYIVGSLLAKISIGRKTILTKK